MTTITDYLAERQRIAERATDGPWEADLDQHGETRGVWPTGPGQEIIIGAYVAADGFDSVGYTLGSDENLTAIVDAHNETPRLLDALGKVLELHANTDGECQECVMGLGYGDGFVYEDWPCPTARAIADALGVDHA